MKKNFDILSIIIKINPIKIIFGFKTKKKQKIIVKNVCTFYDNKKYIMITLPRTFDFTC